MCVQLCHPIALPLSRSLSLRRGGILLHCVFFSQALLLIKDIWVSIGYVQKHVAARALQTFALARARRIYRLVGLVVKASASRAEGPGFESRLRRDFFGVESYQ